MTSDSASTQADDAAQRFYERSYAAVRERESTQTTIDPAVLAAGNHRYSAVFEHLRGKPDQLMIDATHLKAHRTAATL